MKGRYSDWNLESWRNEAARSRGFLLFVQAGVRVVPIDRLRVFGQNCIFEVVPVALKPIAPLAADYNNRPPTFTAENGYPIWISPLRYQPWWFGKLYPGRPYRSIQSGPCAKADWLKHG
jgi:hypothetical protein